MKKLFRFVERNLLNSCSWSFESLNLLWLQMKHLSQEEFTQIIENVRGTLNAVGFEVHPFKV